MPTEEDGRASELRDALQQILGVEAAVVDAAQRRVVLLLRSNIDPLRVERAALELVGQGDDAYDVTVAFQPEQRDRQRVRFVGLDRSDRPDRQVAYRVTLEWSGREVIGEAVGEKGDAIELRTVATAALDAVLEFTPDDLHVRLAGVKQVRAFDAELIVISMYRAGAEPHNLVGAVVAGENPSRAAAVAVLGALNRLLGNYLVT